MNIWNRIFFDLILFISIMVLPWWLSFFLSVYLFFIFNRYVELIFAGLLFDVLYSIEIDGFKTVWPFLLMLSIVLYISLTYLKKYLRSNV